MNALQPAAPYKFLLQMQSIFDSSQDPDTIINT